jgi:hypothetical protein
MRDLLDFGLHRPPIGVTRDDDTGEKPSIEAARSGDQAMNNI